MGTAWVRRFPFSCFGSLQGIQIHLNGNRLSQAVPIFMFWRASTSINSRKWKPPESGVSHLHVCARSKDYRLVKMRIAWVGRFTFMFWLASNMINSRKWHRLRQAVPIFMSFGLLQGIQILENGKHSSSSTNSRKCEPPEWSGSHFHVLACFKYHQFQRMGTARVKRFPFSCCGVL